MANMRKEISKLLQALTTLTHKMVEKSRRRGGGGGYQSYGGYETEESEEETSRRRNTRSPELESETDGT